MRSTDRHRLRRLWVASLIVAAGWTSRAGEPQATPAGDAARPSDVRIDFYAVSNDGQPVSGLKAEDIQLKIDGRTRPITSLTWNAVADANAPESTGPSAPPPFASNAASDGGRSFVIAIDDDSFRPGRERPLRAAVDRFLAALTPRDRVAIVTMPYGGFKLSLTNDFERVRGELAKIVGQGAANESGSEMACRTRRTLESLVGLVSGFAGAEGSVTVLFVTSAMAAPRRDAAMTLPPGMCELTVDMFGQVGAAAGTGRATFYVIQPEDLVLRPGLPLNENIAGAGFAGSDNPLAGIEHLAGVTGGTRLHLAATGELTLVRVARETSGYYTIGFEPQANERNGVSRQLDIRVAREGVLVRGRPNITIPKLDTRAPAKAQTVTPRAMLREARAFRDLPLRGVGYVSNNPGDDRLKIVCLIEPIESAVRLSAAAAGLFDGSGRLVAQWTAESSNLESTPVIGAVLAPKAGTYRLRLAATDDKGRSGSADYDLAAELAPAGGLRVSSLVLGLSRDGGFAPRMVFGAEPVALGYVDIYGRADGITVTAEIARSASGPALGTVPGAIRPVTGEDRSMATVALPIGGLPPGDYVVRLTVAAAGQASGRVLRTLRKQ